jgi:hypothetical protein
MRLATLSALAVTLLLPSCSNASASEITAKDFADTLEKVVVQMESAKDPASAKTAAGNLEPLIAHMNSLKPKLDDLMRNKDADAAVKAKYTPIIDGLIKRLMTQGMRIGNDPKLQEAMQPTLDKMKQ